MLRSGDQKYRAGHAHPSQLRSGADVLLLRTSTCGEPVRGRPGGARVRAGRPLLCEHRNGEAELPGGRAAGSCVDKAKTEYFKGHYHLNGVLSGRVTATGNRSTICEERRGLTLAARSTPAGVRSHRPATEQAGAPGPQALVGRLGDWETLFEESKADRTRLPRRLSHSRGTPRPRAQSAWPSQDS